jgi:aldose 1-epimerase
MRNGQITARAGLCLIAGIGMSFAGSAAVQKASFGKTADGAAVDIYTISGKNGVEARISTYGATLVSLKVPDRTGKLGNVVLGFDSVDNYVKGVPFFGATIGRYGNRIALGKFTLDGKSYQLPTNDGPNSLHGGTKGFDKRLWKAEAGKDAVKLTYVSADGEEGYPGALTVTVTYTLKADNSLTISYDATTTKPTVVNLTNHSYFNLSGNPETPITGEVLKINADAFTPVSSTLIPTGVLKPVAGTPFDFRTATTIGTRIEAKDEQLLFGKGYDHNWVLNKAKAGGLTSAAVLSDPVSGRVMEVKTLEPGLQFYSGNFMDGKPAGKGTVYKHRTGLCLETQHFPDAPNHANFASTVLRPGQTYHTETVLAFSTTK